MSGTDHVAMGHAMPQASADADPFYAPGSGLTPRAANGGKFLSYADLKAQKPLYEVRAATRERSEEHTSELQSLMRISYAVFCLKKKKITSSTKQSNNPVHTSK